MERSTFRTFTDEASARELLEWLAGRELHPALGDSPAYFDPSFANSILSRRWTVELPPAEFAAAEKVLAGFYEMSLQRLPADYYLYSFRNDELRAIFREPDNWGDLDKVLARRLLHDRGDPIGDAQIEELRRQRIKRLARPETASTGNGIYWGYGLSVAAVLLCFSDFGLAAGVIAVMIGSFMMTGRKTLPDGRLVDRFDARSKRHGRRIAVIGVVSILAWFILWMNPDIMW